MKIKSWIKLVGILLIFMGGTGLIGNIDLLFSELPASHTREFTWHFIYAPKLALFINLLFLMAGVFFLLGKRFSAPLSYVALVADIFFRIIPVLILSVYNAVIFILIRPGIDLVLLIIVFHLNASFKDPEKKAEFFSRPLAHLSTGTLKSIVIIGGIFLLVPLYMQFLWIYIYSTVESYLARKTFYSYFPEFLHQSSLLYYLSVAGCIIAIVSGITGMKQLNNTWWILSTLIMSIGSIMLFLNIFQLM